MLQVATDDHLENQSAAVQQPPSFGQYSHHTCRTQSIAQAYQPHLLHQAAFALQQQQHHFAHTPPVHYHLTGTQTQAQPVGFDYYANVGEQGAPIDLSMYPSTNSSTDSADFGQTSSVSSYNGCGGDVGGNRNVGVQQATMYTPTGEHFDASRTEAAANLAYSMAMHQHHHYQQQQQQQSINCSPSGYWMNPQQSLSSNFNCDSWPTTMANSVANRTANGCKIEQNNVVTVDSCNNYIVNNSVVSPSKYTQPNTGMTFADGHDEENSIETAAHSNLLMSCAVGPDSTTCAGMWRASMDGQPEQQLPCYGNNLTLSSNVRFQEQVMMETPEMMQSCLDGVSMAAMLNEGNTLAKNRLAVELAHAERAAALAVHQSSGQMMGSHLANEDDDEDDDDDDVGDEDMKSAILQASGGSCSLRVPVKKFITLKEAVNVKLKKVKIERANGMKIYYFKCSFCSYQTNTSQSMKDHLYCIHCKSKNNYRCNICQQTFGWKNNAQRHMRRKHKIEDQTTKREAIITLI